MFRSKNTRINIEEIFINSHVLESIEERKHKLKDGKFILPEEFIINLIPQNFKANNSVEMKEMRGAIHLKSNLYAIVVIFEDVETKKLYLKVLTALTENQIRTSKNLNKGIHLPRGFIVSKTKVTFEEKRFNEGYENYLNKIEYDELDLQELERKRK